jgi:CheY-like chemotaxis protein/Flp pilus assembly protein TadD
MYFREYNQTRFLIIDSNIKMRLLLERYLKSFGSWYIDLAVDGNEAIHKCQKGIFDVIICDYALGQKNGQQVLEELRYKKLLKNTALFVMMSSDTTQEMVLGAIDYQPDAYISKPITREALKQRLNTLLLDSEALYDIKYAMDCGKVDEAIYLCEQRFRKGSKYSTWCSKTQAMIHLEKGEYKEARKIYQRTLESRPLIWARLGLARIESVEAHYTEAESMLKEIIESHPLCLAAYDLLCDVYLKLSKKKAAQNILFDAVSLSPLAVQRLIKLGELCVQNQDFDLATEAFRNAIEHGEQSVYQNPGNYLHFARSLNETSHILEQEQKVQRNDEALKNIDHARQKFYEDWNEHYEFQSSMIEAKVHKTCERDEEANNALSEAQQFYLMLASELPPEQTLEYAQTLYALDKEDDADIVLTQLAALNPDDATLLQKIADMRDEPVSAQQRVRAAELNKQGIELVDQGCLPEAILVFKEALTHSPKLPALNLNLVQVLLKDLPKEENPSENIALCTEYLDKISHIKENHNQYKRYLFLKEKLKKSRLKYA